MTGIEVCVLVSGCHAVPRFPGIPNQAWRNVRAQRKIVELVESVVAIATQTELVAGFAVKVMEARKTVPGANCGFLRAIIVGRELRATISNEIVRAMLISSEVSDILKRLFGIVSPPICQVGTADHSVTGY
jgi:hypothetical protein